MSSRLARPLMPVMPSPPTAPRPPSRPPPARRLASTDEASLDILAEHNEPTPGFTGFTMQDTVQA